MPERLLAKKVTGDGREITLYDHSIATENAAKALFKEDSRFLNNWLRFFKIEQGQKDKFLLNLRIACLLHDIGKANEDFQKAVTVQGNFQQGIRHEHLSAFILNLPEIRDWVSANSLIDIKIITSAILCHHLKATDKPVDEFSYMYKWGNVLRDNRLPIYLNHTEIKNLFSQVSRLLKINDQPDIKISFFKKDNEIWSKTIKSALQESQYISFKNHLKNNLNQPFYLAGKAGLLAADSLASGLIRENRKMEEWIQNVVHNSVIQPDKIMESIIQPRIDDLSKSGKFTGFHKFQEKIKEQGPRVLMMAGCGQGKTLAAWNWANEISRQQKISKVIFLYPTRGTATEGFKDYVSWAPEAEASLLTGTSEYEFESMFSNPEEIQKSNKDFKIKEEDERLFALAYWTKKYFSATVDQFLGFLQNSYKGLCLLPALSECALIVDEVHSFDKKMFASLLSFLKYFDIPVLCMTATLTPKNKKSLLEMGLNIYPSDTDREELKDLKKLENHPRYSKTWLDNSDAAKEIAIKSYQQGKRVLWVVNTVDRCQQFQEVLKKELKTEVHCYHSRFKLNDRKEVHKKTIAAFKGSKNENTIAVTTQVCEMSLDLDADVLISEIAPISSLVQRFGRANRHLKNGEDFRAELYLYKQDGSSLPYSADEVKMAELFLQNIPDKDISQNILAQKLEEFSAQEYKTLPAACFIDGGYFAMPCDYRDIDENTHSAILDKDFSQVSELIKKRKPIDGFILPTPIASKYNMRNDEHAILPKHLSVVSFKNYSETRGFVK